MFTGLSASFQAGIIFLQIYVYELWITIFKDSGIQNARTRHAFPIFSVQIKPDVIVSAAWNKSSTLDITSALIICPYCGPGYLSRYNDWLRSGRSGYRVPVGARFSAPVQTDPGAHPASCTMGTGSFSGVKSGRGGTLTSHPPSSAVVMKE
jgi:hypothetical protein